VLPNSFALGSVVGLCVNLDRPDGTFCTDDDPQDTRGAPLTSFAVTGNATGQIFNANGIDDNNIGPFSATGAPFDCGMITGASDSFVGAALVSVSTQRGRPTVGDALFVGALVAAGPCVGDCNASGEVTVDELIKMVNVALGNAPVTACALGDANQDGQITVDELCSRWPVLWAGALPKMQHRYAPGASCASFSRCGTPGASYPQRHCAQPGWRSARGRPVAFPPPARDT
jgi:hypothetical protein